MRPAPNRPARRSAKGQAMAIFALVSVLLFVVAGLAVDAGTSYLDQQQARARRRSRGARRRRIPAR